MREPNGGRNDRNGERGRCLDSGYALVCAPSACRTGTDEAVRGATLAGWRFAKDSEREREEIWSPAGGAWTRVVSDGNEAEPEPNPKPSGGHALHVEQELGPLSAPRGTAGAELGGASS